MRHSNRYVTELERIQREVDRLFERILGARDFAEPGLPGDGSWQPAVDVVESPEAFHVYAELPGVQRDDIHLQVHDRRLELTGRRDPVTGEPNFHRMERAYGPFRRSVVLGAEVEEDAISATYRDGVLEVTLPLRRMRQRVPIEKSEKDG